MRFQNKIRARILTVLLTAVLLAGCQQQVDENDIAYRTAGVTWDTTLLRVNGAEITAEEYLYFLGRSVSEMKESGYLADDNAWEETIGNVSTEKYLKDDALNTVVLEAVIREQAARLDVEVSETDREEIDSELARLSDQLSVQGMTLQQALDGMCITEEGFRKIHQTYYLSTALVTKMSESGGELEPTDEKLKLFVEEKGVYSFKHILLSTLHTDGTSGSDAEKAAVYSRAAQLASEIRTSNDPLGTFDQKMNELSDDRDNVGNLIGGGTYTALPGQLDAELEAGVTALTVGQISDPVESGYGYHIILRMDAVNDDTRAAYPQQRMNTLLNQWVEEAAVETTPAYDQLNVKQFYDRLSQVARERETAAQAAAASAQPEPSGGALAPEPTVQAPVG